MRGQRLELGTFDPVARARSQVGLGIHYSLRPGENGGSNPHEYSCAAGSAAIGPRTADCVGLMAWSEGIDRWQPEVPQLSNYGGWLNSNSIMNFRKRSGLFSFVVSVDTPFKLGECGDVRLGDVLVVPGKPGKYGHVAVITAVGYTYSSVSCVHCSPSNYDKDSTPGAIDETPVWSYRAGGRQIRGAWRAGTTVYVFRRTE